MKPLISIIVPIYNAEEYLDKCISSIVNQTYKNLEIILVNDGSTDKSGIICDKWKEKDERIIVINKENGGVSSARNEGLKIMSGIYYSFVDADDWLECDFVETLSKHTDSNYDIIVSGTVDKNISGETLSTNKITNGEFLNNELIKNLYKKSNNGFVGPVAKLYLKKSFEHIFFKENLKYGEDVEYNIRCLIKTNRLIMLDYIGYNVLKNSNSSTNKLMFKYNSKSTPRNNIIWPELEAALTDFLNDEKYLATMRNNLSANAYYREIRNLLAEDCPYTKNQIINEIKKIHKDSEFKKLIRQSKYSDLSPMNKLAKFCSSIGNAYITYIVFSLALSRYKKSL